MKFHYFLCFSSREIDAEKARSRDQRSMIVEILPESTGQASESIRNLKSWRIPVRSLLDPTFRTLFIKLSGAWRCRNERVYRAAEFKLLDSSVHRAANTKQAGGLLCYYSVNSRAYRQTGHCTRTWNSWRKFHEVSSSKTDVNLVHGNKNVKTFSPKTEKPSNDNFCILCVERMYTSV